MEVSGQPHAPVALAPSTYPRPSRVASELSYILWKRETFLAPSGTQTPAIRRVACHYSDWAIRASRNPLKSLGDATSFNNLLYFVTPQWQDFEGDLPLKLSTEDRSKWIFTSWPLHSFIFILVIQRIASSDISFPVCNWYGDKAVVYLTIQMLRHFVVFAGERHLQRSVLGLKPETGHSSDDFFRRRARRPGTRTS
jgi:hypothetical protein